MNNMQINEDYNTELEKAISEFTEKRRHDSSLNGGYPPRAWFIEGVKWQKKQDEIKNRWIPIEEMLPDNQDVVLVKTDKLCFSTAYFHGMKSGFIVYGDDAYVGFGTITHWKAIN